MTAELLKRIAVGWTREQLAVASNVSVSAIYLLERVGTAGPEDDVRIRAALAQAELERARPNHIILEDE